MKKLIGRFFAFPAPPLPAFWHKVHLLPRRNFLSANTEITQTDETDSDTQTDQTASEENEQTAAEEQSGDYATGSQKLDISQGTVPFIDESDPLMKDLAVYIGGAHHRHPDPFPKRHRTQISSIAYQNHDSNPDAGTF